MSRFWKELHKAMGTELCFSTAFHPQTDGQSERTIQTLEDLLRAYALDRSTSWDASLSLVEFTYNNSSHSTIKMAPFEALYGRKCRSPICWDKSADKILLGPELVERTANEIATEPYGFSNGGGSFGPPDFADALIEVADTGRAIRIDLN